MGSFAVDIPKKEALSPDGSCSILVRPKYDDRRSRFLILNDALEDALSLILRHGYDFKQHESQPTTATSIKTQLVTWAKHIAQDIPGYSNWKEIYDFTLDSLYQSDSVPGEDAAPIGTELDLYNSSHFDSNMRHSYALHDEATERHRLADQLVSLATARRRLNILDRFTYRYTSENPMPTTLALLWRKVYYSYKLRETLLGQMGYHSGSLELAAGMKDDFEYSMYLIAMKARRPDRIHPFKAPKAMASYVTESESLLPWNNQFSLSYGFNEFGSYEMPRFAVRFIEQRLVDFIRDDGNDAKWKMLCAFLSWCPEDVDALGERDQLQGPFSRSRNIEKQVDQVDDIPEKVTLSDRGFKILTLHNIVNQLVDSELRLKMFFTRFLRLPWSDTDFRKQDNPFAALYNQRLQKSLRTGAVIDHVLSNVTNADIKDPRLAGKDLPPLLLLKDATQLPHVVGRKGNLLLAPDTAIRTFHGKLRCLSTEQLDSLFENISGYPRTLRRAEKLDAICTQAAQATDDWWQSAVENCRPVYTGPSGHVLACARMFIDSLGPVGCGQTGHPNLE